jgi:hypothetical protein
VPNRALSIAKHLIFQDFEIHQIAVFREESKLLIAKRVPKDMHRKPLLLTGFGNHPSQLPAILSNSSRIV